MAIETLYLIGDEINPPQDCEFCLMEEGEGTPQYRERYGLNQVLDLNIPKQFTAIHDVAPLGENVAHVLLVPNRYSARHPISLAVVPYQEQLAQSRDLIVEAYRKIAPENPIIMFEHGPGVIEGEAIACGGCSVDHAHGHVVMLPPNASMSTIKTSTERILESNGWVNIASRGVESPEIFSNISIQAERNPYLHIGMIQPAVAPTAVTYIQELRSEIVPSQLMRRVISEAIYNKRDHSYWHYRDIMDGYVSQARIEELKAEVLRFRALLDQR